MAVPLIRTDIVPFATYQPPYKFWLQERQEYSRQANGVTRSKDLGTPIWRMECRTTELSLANAMTLEAMLRSLDGANRSFEAFDVRRPTPLLGNGYSGGGVISSFSSDYKTTRFSGLPAGLQLSIGDYFAYDFNGIRYLHQLMEPALANVNGITSLFEVRPNYPQGFVSGQAINFGRPSAVMAVEPGSVEVEVLGTVLATVSWRAFQRLS